MLVSMAGFRSMDRTDRKQTIYQYERIRGINMTDQELKKLKRDELLQIMIAQSKRISALKKRLDETEKKLADKELALKATGNIAEASLKLNHIFEDAQAAADQYLYNVKKLAQRELARQGLLKTQRAVAAEEAAAEKAAAEQAEALADNEKAEVQDPVDELAEEVVDAADDMDEEDDDQASEEDEADDEAPSEDE